jgi:hypothetical protein
MGENKKVTLDIHKIVEQMTLNKQKMIDLVFYERLVMEDERMTI